MYVERTLSPGSSISVVGRKIGRNKGIDGRRMDVQNDGGREGLKKGRRDGGREGGREGSKVGNRD